jgi:hypothetical protein
MNGIEVGQDIFMDEGARFSDVELSGARIKEQLGISGSTVSNNLNLNAIRVEHLFMNGGSDFGNIDLNGSHTEGNSTWPGQTYEERSP